MVREEVGWGRKASVGAREHEHRETEAHIVRWERHTGSAVARIEALAPNGLDSEADSRRQAPELCFSSSSRKGKKTRQKVAPSLSDAEAWAPTPIAASGGCPRRSARTCTPRRTPAGQGQASAEDP